MKILSITLFAFVSILFTVMPGKAAENALKSPPAKAGVNERQLKKSDISNLTATPIAREIIQSIYGRSAVNETVFYSVEYGYIYRYNIIRDKNKPNEISSVFVLWTKDKSKFKFADFPVFKLPG